MPDFSSFGSRFAARLRRLQRADLAVRRRWLVGLSSGAFVVIILLWIFYLHLTLPSASTGTDAGLASSSTSQDTAPQASTGDSFFGTLGRGAQEIWGKIATGIANLSGSVRGAFSSFRSTLSTPNSFSVMPAASTSAGTTNGY